MSPLNHIRVDLDHKVVICVHHKHCLIPNSVALHFSRKHGHNTSPRERTEIKDYVDSLSDRLWQNYSEVEIPSEPCPPIQSLELHAESLRCNYCSHIVAGKESGKSNMKQHLRSHNIYAGPEKLFNQPLVDWWSQHWEPVLCQRFFERCPVDGTNCLTLFPVIKGAADDTLPRDPPIVDHTTDCTVSSESETLDPILSAVDVLHSQLAVAEARLHEDNKAQFAVIPAADERQTNPYLEHTQFQKCLAGIDWATAGEYTTPRSTAQLKYLQDIVKSTVLVYQHTVSNTSRWARIRVMQENIQHVPVAPLFHYQAFDTRHSSTLIKVITFFYQIYVTGLPRPPTFQITTTQLSAWLAVQEHLENMDNEFPVVNLHHTRDRLEQMEALCHRFWLALIEQTGCAGDFELAVVTPLAFVAVDASQQKFRPAYNFATDLSAMKKLARFAACQRLWDSLTEGEDQTSGVESPQTDPTLGTQPAEAAELILEQDTRKTSMGESEELNRSVNDDFKTWIYRYLTVEYMTPMSWIITTAHYISRFRYGETLDAFVRWNGSQVTVRDVSTTFDDYTAMVWTLYDEATTLMSSLTFTAPDGLKDLPEAPWASIQCNPSDDAPGYSPFLPSQAPFTAHRDYVKNGMIKALLDKRHKSTTIANLSNVDEVKRYGDTVQSFLDKLFLLVHFTSGQPGRLTEVSSIQIENSHSNGSRNIFMFEGHVALVPRYHKGYNRDKSLKLIYRFLPRPIGQLLVWYLSLVRPFYQLVSSFQSTTAGPHYHQARSPFLWADKEGKQFQHTTRQADIMKRTTRRLLGVAIGPSLMRHLLIAFGRKNDKKRSGQVQVLTPEEVEEFSNDMDSEAREVQAGHTSNTATAVYALETHQIFRNPFSAPEASLKVSQAWHITLGFEGVLEADSSKQKIPKPDTTLAMRIQTRGSINTRRVLKETMGANATFRGQQQNVIDSIVQGTPVVSYIAGTGSGKSLCFYLPACCEGYGQTVIITPLIALRNDITFKCNELSLTSSIYGQPTFSETVRVILAMPEHLAQPKFSALINRRRDMGHLERLVLDEFHYVLLPDHEYRPLLLNIRSLARFGTPITLLSATVPPEQESAAYRMLGLDGTVTTFRESTSRSNIRYEVETWSQTHPTSVTEMAAYVAEVQRSHNKIIVYVAYTSTVKALASALQCSAYYGTMPEHERISTQEDFHSAREGILVATTAINAGVDFLDVRAVIWLGQPDHPINFLQAAGRGGRDGLPALARVVVGKGLPTFLDKCALTPRRVLETFLEAGTTKSGCLRVPIDAYADGTTTRIHCRANEERCSNCEYLNASKRPSNVRPHAPVTPLAKGTRPSFHGSSYNLPRADTQSNPVHPNRSETMPSSPPVPDAYAISPPSRSSPTFSMRRPTHVSSPAPKSTDSPTPRTYHSTPFSPHITAQKRAAPQEQTLYTEASIEPMHPTPTKIAKFNRTLEFNQRRWLESEKSAARLQEQIRQTAAMWTNNCVRCFTEGLSFDHPKRECGSFTRDLVDDFRRGRMKNNMGKPQCWTCFMPLDMCARFYDETTHTVRSSRSDVPCTHPHIVLDTWACMWEYCHDMRKVWLARMRELKELDGNHEKDFRQYFSEMIPVPGAKPIGRIAYDVNWLTHKYFLDDREAWKQLSTGEHTHTV